MMVKREIQVEEKLPLLQTLPLSLQHLFAMFGATVLVPILFKVDPATVLLFNGIGTLLYLFICKGRIPAYLGSSFAFLSPVFVVLGKYDYSAALGGFIVVGLIFSIVALIIGAVGTKWIDVVFPPAAMGAIVAVIGLELAPIAAQMAGLAAADPAKYVADPKVITVSMFTLGVTILGSVIFRGFLAIIPILVGVVSGYILSIFMGLVSTESIAKASWFAKPTFYSPTFDLNAIMIIVPAALVVIAEHVGHLFVTSNKHRGPGFGQRPWLAPLPAGQRLVHFAVRLLRFHPQHHLWRKHRCHGHHQGLQHLGDRRSRHHRHYPLLCG